MYFLTVNLRGIPQMYIMCNFLGTPLEPRVIMLEDRLLEFRDQGRAFETHNSLTTSWNILSYPVNPVHWFTYYVMLRSFSDDMLLYLQNVFI